MADTWSRAWTRPCSESFTHIHSLFSLFFIWLHQVLVVGSPVFISANGIF